MFNKHYSPNSVVEVGLILNVFFFFSLLPVNAAGEKEAKKVRAILLPATVETHLYVSQDSYAFIKDDTAYLGNSFIECVWKTKPFLKLIKIQNKISSDTYVFADAQPFNLVTDSGNINPADFNSVSAAIDHNENHSSTLTFHMKNSKAIIAMKSVLAKQNHFVQQGLSITPKAAIRIKKINLTHYFE